MVSEFLTGIAREINRNIKEVRFVKLEPKHLGRVNVNGTETGYSIKIDREKLLCSLHIIFTLFHEVAHVELGHCEYYRNYIWDERYKKEVEIEANSWAFKHLCDVTDMVCLQCLADFPEKCLKGLSLNRHIF